MVKFPGGQCSRVDYRQVQEDWEVSVWGKPGGCPPYPLGRLGLGQGGGGARMAAPPQLPVQPQGAALPSP